jgi:predicted DNA-binding ribbon-helix-helix protein
MQERSQGYNSYAYQESHPVKGFPSSLLSEKGESGALKSTLISRNITVLGHRTSVRLEPEMWSALKDISRREGCTIHDICSLIQLRKAKATSLTAAIRVFLMLYYRAGTTEDGHARAGHGNFENMKRRANVSNDLRDAEPKLRRIVQ